MKERRLCPRYEFETDLSVQVGEARAYRVNSCDVSEVGISFYLSQSMLSSLNSAGQHLDIGDRIQLSLKDHAKGADIAVFCQIKHMRRLSQDRYLIGTWFERIKPDFQNKLNGLLHLAKKSVYGHSEDVKHVS